MLGITSSPMMNQVSMKGKKQAKKQNVTTQQPVVENQTDAKPKKKMSKLTKGLLIAGATALALLGGWGIAKKVSMNRTISDKEIDRLVEELSKIE